MLRTRFMLGLLSVAALGLLGSGACSLVAGLDDIHVLSGEGGKDGGTEPCSNDQQCDDGEPCTIDSCPAGTCVHEDRTDGIAPNEAQTADDCKKVLCKAGKSEQVVDDDDVPDDNEDCTIDTCQNGGALHTAKADDTICKGAMGEAGTCNAGTCKFACTKDQDCPVSTACSSYVCDVATGQCIETKAADGTILAAQTPGDCKTALCVNGVEGATNDDTDVPDDGNDCTMDSCVNGQTQFTNNALGTNCGTFMGGMMGFCDDMGSCSECSKDSECPAFAADNECQSTQCIDFTCVTTFTAQGTPLGAALQTPFDCHELRCSGASNVPVNAVLDTDLPNDNNDCTIDVCMAGIAAHAPAVQGTVCNGGPFVCNNNGQCGCQGNQDCSLPQTCGGGGTALVCGCTPKVCAQLSPPQTCGIITLFQDTCNLPLNCNTSSKNGSETDVDCGGPVANCPTRCGQGKMCSVGTDCASGFCADGFCCDTACNGLCQACSAAKKGGGQNGVCGNVAVGTDPDNECALDAVSTCQKTGECNGAGACQLHAAGVVCAAASCSAGVAQNADTCNGTGTCVDQGTVNCSPYVCGATACLTSCTVAANCVSTHYCAGSTCTPKKANGVACGANNQCTSGNCVDGVCCNVACAGTCVACTAAKNNGVTGTCGNIPSNSDPDNECANGECNGAGACESADGAACMSNSQCISGFCADGFCCASACTSLCHACSNAKTGSANGVCAGIISGTDPDNECSGAQVCVAGACQ